jgi:hypothetical protein
VHLTDSKLYRGSRMSSWHHGPVGRAEVASGEMSPDAGAVPAKTPGLPGPQPMRSDEFAQWWLASDLGRLWEVATVHGVRPDGSDAVTLRLELPESAHFAAGQYYLVRMRVRGPTRAKPTAGARISPSRSGTALGAETASTEAHHMLGLTVHCPRLDPRIVDLLESWRIGDLARHALCHHAPT